MWYMMTARRFYISGRVQGVFFRAATKSMATKLNLRGHAINLPDGRVEVLAVGAEDALSALEDWLHEGPPAARVMAVDAVPADASEAAGRRDFVCG